MSKTEETEPESGLTIEDRFAIEDNVVERLRRFHFKLQLGGAALLLVGTIAVVKLRE